MHVLLIEDHSDLAATVGDHLAAEGHVVDFAYDGLTGLHLAVSQPPDVIVLDLGLPGMDGLTLCERLRRDGRQDTPILMLTARTSEADLLAGFDAGADDYLVKPFSLAVLSARLRSLAQRTRQPSTRLRVADLEMDTETRLVTRASRRLTLTPTGFQLLERLLQASPRVVERDKLEQHIWGDDRPNSEAALRVHLHALRNEVDAEGERPLLHTVRSVGYRLAADDA
jgi:DNA-binding response OmpR family regulator